jgi:arginyl-tRNA synthetase
MAIAIELLGYQKQQFNVLIMQMVKLTQNGQELKMSKRSGTSLTMRDLIDKIGKDAARWYLVSQAITTHLDIDVDRAVAKSNNNPIYYVQYAHARINQLINKVSYKQPQNYNLLTTPHERELINQLHYFKHTIEMVSKNYEVNKMTLYLTNLAKTFHAFYANNKIIDPQKLELSTQRYFLAMAVKQIIANGLKLLGITPINQM